jgi:hypothetical protein
MRVRNMELVGWNGEGLNMDLVLRAGEGNK